MIIKVVSVLLITLFFNIDFFSNSRTVMNLIEINDVISPNSHSRIEKLLKYNSAIISEETKRALIILKDKLERFEALNQEEVEFIRQCELNVIRTKLGEEQFEEYCKLIKKREGEGEFLPPERYRLYELEKQLKDIR
jgi:hypothetical protein